MAKQVQLSDAAYKMLKATKRSDESFSDVVLRLVRPRADAMTMFGAGLVQPAFDLRKFRAQSAAAERARERRQAGRRRRGRA